MATLNTQSFSTITANWAAAVQGASSQLLDFATGSILRALNQAQAAVVLWLQGLVLQTLIASRLSTAVQAAGPGNSVGPDVDSFVADFGLTRIPAIAAVGQVTFARFTPTNPALIPASQVVNGVIQPGGALLQTLDGTQSFTVIADNTQAAYVPAQNGYVIGAGVGSAVVTVQANNPGLQGNILAGTLTVLQTGISGVDTVSNPASFTSGRNAETNAALQARFANTLQSLSKGTTAAIGAALTAFNGNLQYTVQIAPLSNPAVTVTVDDGSGAIPAALLNGAASAVAATIADGISFAVLAATALTANVSMSITTAAGFVHSSVAAAVQTALANYIAGLGLGNSLNFFNLAEIALDVPGCIGVTSLSLNNGNSNLVPTPSQTVKSGTIAVS
ncbi:baseplate J/gp47 family protein [Bradyrhizobium sp.]|uniref:baseplate J/gp47 family protein n=1 Tax=Bradyrhizobium sp. TaxID=376 RepID=UPI001EB99A4D|nr:baseplate J/gp47 family protein [Bradyrhizobium sp.]MBV9984495.1 baseplate J/gp47 family protein [Bradyrhizobium sp.]